MVLLAIGGNGTGALGGGRVLAAVELVPWLDAPGS